MAVAVIALASSGGGGDTQLVSGDALAQAARATEKLPGASVTADATIDVDGLAKPLKMHLEGVSDSRGHSGRLAGAYADFPKELPGQTPDGKVPVEMVMVLPDVYMKSPLFDKALPEGKSWLHIDFAKTGRQLGIGDPTQFGTADPSQVVSNLRATSDRVERLGTEDVRGVATTHYKATVELKKLPALVPPSERPAATQKSERLIHLLGADSYPIEVWVDRKHVVRRMDLTMKMQVQGQSMTMDMRSEMYDFGPKPRAKRPPAGEVYEAPSP
jgi:hypothetical protein